MFDLLFKCPATIRRHLEAPYAEERQQDWAHSTLQFTAQDLPWIACKLSIYPDLRKVTQRYLGIYKQRLDQTTPQTVVISLETNPLDRRRAGDRLVAR